MKIILLKDIPKVGKRYEMKNISDGYALNMLIPKGLAVAATADVIKRIDLERSRDEGEKKLHQDLLLKNLAQLEGVTVVMEEKANEKGHLFAGVHTAEIIPAIQKQTQLQIAAENIILKAPLKQTGVHEITVQAAGKTVKFNLEIKGIK